jgi:transcriptional regulator with XRE-family HTH domain
MTVIKKGAGHMLKEEIDKQGLRYAFVAEKAGVTPQTLSKYLHDRIPINVNNLYSICKVVGVDYKKFLK